MATLATTLGRVGMAIVASLMTETLLKKVIIRLAEQLAKKTETDADDKIVRDIKKEWGIED